MLVRQVWETGLLRIVVVDVFFIEFDLLFVFALSLFTREYLALIAETFVNKKDDIDDILNFY